MRTDSRFCRLRPPARRPNNGAKGRGAVWEKSGNDCRRMMAVQTAYWCARRSMRTIRSNGRAGGRNCSPITSCLPFAKEQVLRMSPRKSLLTPRYVYVAPAGNASRNRPLCRRQREAAIVRFCVQGDCRGRGEERQRARGGLQPALQRRSGGDRKAIGFVDRPDSGVADPAWGQRR